MRTIGIVACGPSATAQDAQKLAAICDETIAVNDAWRLFPADHLYGSDMKWWKWALPAVKRDFKGKLWTQIIGWDIDPAEWGINCLDAEVEPGLCTEPGRIFCAGNSGYAAINLAGHLGNWDATLLLLGYDMQDGPPLVDRPAHLNVGGSLKFATFRREFAAIKPEDYGLRILNCSRQTALRCFPRHDLGAL